MTIRRRRRERGWTQSQLAEFTGLSLRTIQRIERGAPPNDESLKALASVFETHLSDLRHELPIDESALSEEEKVLLREIRNRRGFFVELIAYLIVVPLLAWSKWLLDVDAKWVGAAALGWGIWLGFRAFEVFDASDLFGPGWERRELDKRRRKEDP